jgi:hypothetical protein
MNRQHSLALLGGLMISLLGCTAREDQTMSAPVALEDAQAIQNNLRTIASSRILFGHQSVGRDVLAGLQRLAGEHGVELRIEAIDGLPPPEGPGIFHSTIGRNGDPAGKCEAFAHLLTRPERPAYDVAMMKFCYVDLGESTPLSAGQMLDRYSRTVANLREARPDVSLVHVTLPLRADPTGMKTRVKRILGKATWEDADNALRNAFNEGLRARFANEPLFDLAAAQSTHPDGTRSSFSRDGRTIFTLVTDYTSDGGHLNEAGQHRVALALLRELAAVAQKES